MTTRFPKIASTAALLLAVAACNGIPDPFVLDHATGSCQYPTVNGYDSCEDFLGTEYNQSIAQNTCATAGGTWSPDACPTAGLFGTCAVEVGSGDAQNVAYRYSLSADSSAGSTALAAQTACGLAGGTFSTN